MVKPILQAYILSLILFSCQTEPKAIQSQPYLRWVGDIEQNHETDNTDFKVCKGEDNVFQYFNIGEGPVYKNEKTAILNAFHAQYQPINNHQQNGLVRIRFIVNCEGKAGRFRVLQSDNNYQEKAFDKRIVDQLLKITKSIEDWQILYRDEVTVDYYMYLIFKIKNGQLIDILP